MYYLAEQIRDNASTFLANAGCHESFFVLFSLLSSPLLWPIQQQIKDCKEALAKLITAEEVTETATDAITDIIQKIFNHFRTVDASFKMTVDPTFADSCRYSIPSLTRFQDSIAFHDQDILQEAEKTTTTGFVDLKDVPNFSFADFAQLQETKD
jgi:enoyl-[acyl-carrier-protein] reductase (NADH)